MNLLNQDHKPINLDLPRVDGVAWLVFFDANSALEERLITGHGEPSELSTHCGGLLQDLTK